MLERKKNLSECEKKANEKNIYLINENADIKKKINDLTEKLQAETKNRINLESNIDLLTKKLNAKDNEIDNKEKQYKELQEKYSNVTEKLSGLTRDFNKEKMELEIELKSNLQKGDAEIALLKIINYKMLKKILTNKKKKFIHKKEIMEIEEKIIKTLKIKEDIIQNLQNEVEMKEVAIKKYEEMINQQRNEFFGKK